MQDTCEFQGSLFIYNTNLGELNLDNYLLNAGIHSQPSYCGRCTG